MPIKIDGKIYRNLTEQVKKNMDDIQELQENPVGVSQEYVDQQDATTLQSAKSYADEKDTALQTQINATNDKVTEVKQATNNNTSEIADLKNVKIDNGGAAELSELEVNGETTLNATVTVGGDINVQGNVSIGNSTAATVAQLASKLDKVTTTTSDDMVYVKLANGTQSQIAVVQWISNNAIVRYTNDGHINSQAATTGYQVINLNQLNTKMQSAAGLGLSYENNAYNIKYRIEPVTQAEYDASAKDAGVLYVITE